MTRHELKEQLQHDPFTDNVGTAVNYVAGHRRQVTRWIIVGGVVLLVAVIAYAFIQHQKSERQQALQSALDVVEAPVSAQPDPFGKSFPTQAAKDQAAAKALGDVAAKYSGSEEGNAAQYYLGGLQAQGGKYNDAERNFKAVADSSSQVSSLAKVALAQLYRGQGKTEQAQRTLEALVQNPNSLVSKDQATLLLADLLKTKDPKRAKQLADPLKGATTRPAVQRAAEQILQPAK